MRTSIAFRLFAVTFVVIMLFVGLLLALLAAGFSSFYEQRQKSDLKAELRQMGREYAMLPQRGGIPGMPPYITQFESDYFAKVAVTTVKNGAIATVLMGGSAPRKQVAFRDGTDGNRLNVPGQSEMILVPNPPLQSEIDGIMFAARQWVNNEAELREVMEEGKTLAYRSTPEVLSSQDASVHQLIAVTRVSGSDARNGVVLFAVASLQPVTHAASVFKVLSVYVLGGALVLVLLLSFGYARIVTKPLIRLNALAGRLANPANAERVRWQRNDEIGELARTLDLLADNWHGTLSELQSANEKLRLDIEREKRLERMRRNFIAGVSHELKTPLSLIGGYAEGLKDNIGSGAKREKYAEVILEETRRMAAIVADMLDLSHLESGQYSLKLESFRLPELLSDAADRAAVLGADKSLVVEANLSPGSEERAMAVADRFRVDQVLTNLVTNAVRHAPEGGRIEVTAAADGDDWHIAVYNEGEPIPEEELRRIWGQFYRVDKARSRESGGTGIGLAIVRQLLELHGSRYGVRNERKGVSFGFTLRREQR
ncbi:HAMP domain-containing protein [Paenibacillus lycopersici]|uniref:histidine kinase n=1 Tax=Paenibacillus lycopersici TaxID=2704462 RepID=A0A6C0G4A4_9BACL|nr:HAMP domain-containing sensor histidine kinase [Paenibacillus lycopersici]QHT62209.1 HAMP domain-containing protein [Paenibacillus lycopersici]